MEQKNDSDLTINDIETTFVESPEQYEKPIIQNIQLHRSYVFEYEAMETVLYGGHRWFFYRPFCRKFNPDEEYPKYFDDYPKYKRQIENLFKTVTVLDWLPLERLYLNARYGIINTHTKKKDFKYLNFAESDDREYFLKRNTISINDFLRWILIVANWESIDSCKTIISRFYFLLERFKIFIRLDLTPTQMVNYFNSKLLDIGDHNIEPIETIQLFDYYKFVMNPVVYSISVVSAIDKLFYIVKESNFLKGHLASFRPSFFRFSNMINKIFKYQYTRILPSAENIKRLTEKQSSYFDVNGKHCINENIFIPYDILEKYSFIPTQKFETNPVTEEELSFYLKNINEQKEKMLVDKAKERDLIIDKYKKIKTDIADNKDTQFKNSLKKLIDNDIIKQRKT
jgi:hypothetical protein